MRVTFDGRVHPSSLQAANPQTPAGRCRGVGVRAPARGCVQVCVRACPERRHTVLSRGSCPIYSAFSSEFRRPH